MFYWLIGWRLPPFLQYTYITNNTMKLIKALLRKALDIVGRKVSESITDKIKNPMAQELAESHFPVTLEMLKALVDSDPDNKKQIEDIIKRNKSVLLDSYDKVLRLLIEEKAKDETVKELSLAALDTVMEVIKNKDA